MSTKSQKFSKNLVIIGGGYGGVQAIKALERSSLLNKYNIILIEKRTHFYHNVASLRASVEDIDEKVFIPYSGLLKKNIQVIHATATTLHKNEVIINPSHEELGSHIPFEYAIIATGAEYPEPGKLHKDTKEENIEHLKATREAIKAAKSIVIFGGGPVGIELSGEIKEAYPEKEVTIIERNGSLIFNTSFPEKFKVKAKETIEKLGVKVLLNEKVVWDSGFGHDFKARTVRTESGKEIHADLQFVAFGTKPNGHLVGTLDSSLINQDTHGIKVRPTLQLDNPEYSHIYAVGDAIDLKGESKLAMKANKHSATAIKNIQASVDGTALTDYKSDPDAMVITAGKNSGASFIPFFGGITAGGWVSKTLKSKSLFIDNSWSTLNVTPPKA